MPGDYSEAALGRKGHFTIGQAKPGYLVAKSNSKSLSSLHYGARESGNRIQQTMSSADHLKEGQRYAKKSANLSRNHKATRTGEFQSGFTPTRLDAWKN